ncbi:hypothetical protein DIPPA_00365 [Diplonema papillatum]|nr:hypothetical protein DIPPA_00365 [Diplonema papillatum]
MPPKAQARNGDELLEREKRMEELERSLKEREDKLREAEERLKEQQQQRGRPLEDPDEPRAKRSRPAPQQELRPEALLPMLDVDRAGAIFDAFEDEYPGFWQKMDADALQELALAGDEREALELLDRHVPPVGNSMVLDEDEEDDFKMLEATFWKDAPIGVGGFALLEGTVSRLSTPASESYNQAARQRPEYECEGAVGNLP